MSYTTEFQHEATGAATKAARDLAWRAGHLLIWDASNPLCNPQLAAGGIAQGQAYTNLAESGLSGGAALLTGLTWNGGAGGVATANAQTGSPGGISFGTGYDLHSSNPDFHVSLTVKPLSTANAASTYQTLFGLGTSNQALFLIDSGADNKTLRWDAGVVAGSPVMRAIPGVTLDAINTIDIVRIGSVWSCWVNGVQKDGFNKVVALPDESAVSTLLGSNRAGCVLYRAAIENMALTAADEALWGNTWTAAQAVANEQAAVTASGFA